MLLEGVFPAMTTPFYPDGRLYLRKLEHNVERYSRTPCAGMVVLGSTGEAVMLGDEETRDVLRHAASAAALDKVLLAGVARESLSETLRLAEYAAAKQYDAVLVRNPNYYTPSYGLTSGALPLLTYYRAIADRSPLPVILYSIPRFTNVEIPVEVVAELAQHPNIIGIKDSSGSLERIQSLLAATRSAPKRSVLVTPVFTAVTSRMMMAETEAVAIPGLRVRRTSGRRNAGCCGSSCGQNAQQGRWVPDPVGFSGDSAFGFGGGSLGSRSGLCRLRAAGLPGGLHGLEGKRSGGRERKAAAADRRRRAWSLANTASRASSMPAISTGTMAGFLGFRCCRSAPMRRPRWLGRWAIFGIDLTAAVGSGEASTQCS